MYKFDRFGRNRYETAIHKKELKDNGVKVVSATEYLPDTPEAIIFESMLEGFEQLNGHNSLKKIIQNSKQRFQRKVKAESQNSSAFYVAS